MSHLDWWTQRKDTRTPEQKARHEELNNRPRDLSRTYSMDEFMEIFDVMPPTKWYTALWYQELRPIVRWPQTKWWELKYLVRFRILHIRTNGYWHRMHCDVDLCPDCDWHRPCPDYAKDEDHLCTSQLYRQEDLDWAQIPKPIICYYCKYELPPLPSGSKVDVQ